MSGGSFGLQAALADHFAEYEDLSIYAGPTLAGATLHALQFLECTFLGCFGLEFDRVKPDLYTRLKHYHSSFFL